MAKQPPPKSPHQTPGSQDRLREQVQKLLQQKKFLQALEEIRKAKRLHPDLTQPTRDEQASD